MRQLGDHLNEGVERALPEPVVIAASMVRITSTSIRIILAEPKEVAIEIRPLIKPIVLNPGKDAGGNQQHHYAGEGVGHSTVGDFQPAKDVLVLKPRRNSRIAASSMQPTRMVIMCSSGPIYRQRSARR
nr:Uncharacterised protein [Klebsiella pneumoniae]